MKYIVTADDYGVSPIIDDAIQVMIALGTVNSVAGFANGKDEQGHFSVAKLKRLKQNFPQVKVGIHFTLTSGKALSGRDSNLTTRWSRYFKNFLKQNPTKIELDALKKELVAQVAVFESAQLPIEHFSDHVGILTLIPETAEVYFEVVKEYNQKHGVDVPVRNPMLTAAYAQEGCLDDSKMFSLGRLGSKVMSGFDINPQGMKDQLTLLQSHGLKSTDYFVEHLYKQPKKSILDCITGQLPALGLNPMVQYRVSDEPCAEIVTHLAERPPNFDTNNDYQRALKDLQEYKGISIGYLKYKRHEEYLLLKSNPGVFNS